MPKAPKPSSKKKVIHPNSRQAAQLARKGHREQRAEKKQKAHSLKVEVLGEKLKWFFDNLEEEKLNYTQEDMYVVIEKYLCRFDEELEQIEIVNSMKGRTGQQHAARLDIIRSTMETEKQEYSSVGLEVPDLVYGKSLQSFRDWSGELRHIQNIKLKRIRLPAESKHKMATGDGNEKAAENNTTEQTPVDNTEAVDPSKESQNKDTDSEKTQSDVTFSSCSDSDTNTCTKDDSGVDLSKDSSEKEEMHMDVSSN